MFRDRFGARRARAWIGRGQSPEKTMPLPEDWDTINWAPNVVILPPMTEGIRTNLINTQRYPQYPRGYFMMAYVDAGGIAVGYNALEVGTAGKQMSEFVFWHELGHHALGHTGALGPDSMNGVTFSQNNELDADQYSYTHWMSRRDAYGLAVVLAAIAYFGGQGNAPGDAAHPAPAVRGNRLRLLLQAEQLSQFTFQYDPATDPVFVREVLVQLFGYGWDDAAQLIALIAAHGAVTIVAKGTSRTARLIDRVESARMMEYIRAKMRFAGQMGFHVTYGPLAI